MTAHFDVLLAYYSPIFLFASILILILPNLIVLIGPWVCPSIHDFVIDALMLLYLQGFTLNPFRNLHACHLTRVLAIFSAALSTPRYFPFKVGAKYTIPAPIMLALYAEKKRKEWEATPEYRLLGEPAAKVLPSWMKDTKITQEHVDFVDNVAKYPNGTWKLDLLRDMLRRDIDEIMNDAAEADDDSMPEDVVAKVSVDPHAQ